MSKLYTWDYIIKAYETMYEKSKAAESENQKTYADHAKGMLSLIPKIRDFIELHDFELDASLGRLVLKSKTTGARFYVSSKQGLIYVVEKRDEIEGTHVVNEYDVDHIVQAIHDIIINK